MKREELKALGLTEEQIEKVMTQNGIDIENAKKPYKDYEDIKGQLKTANETIEDMKKSSGDVDKLNTKIKEYETTIANMKTEAENKAKTTALIEALKEEKLVDPEYFIFKQLNTKIKEYETTIANMKTEAENKAKTTALIEALKEEKLVDPEYFIFKQGGLEKFNFGQDGKPIGVSDVVKPFKESNRNWFEQEQQPPSFTGFTPNMSNRNTPPTADEAMQQQVQQIFGIKGENK